MVQTFRPRLVWAFLVALAVLVTALAALPAQASAPTPLPGIAATELPSEPSIEVATTGFCNVVPAYEAMVNGFMCPSLAPSAPWAPGHVYALVRNTGHAAVMVKWAAFTVGGVALPAACFPFRNRADVPATAPLQVGCMATSSRADLFTSGPTRFDMSVVSTGSADEGFWAVPGTAAATSRVWQVTLPVPTARMAVRAVSVSSSARVPARVLVSNAGTASGTFRFAAVPGVKFVPASGAVGPGYHAWVLAYPTSAAKFCRRVQAVLTGRAPTVIGLTFNGARGCPSR